MRYYGGVRRLVGLEGNVFEYLRLGEEKGWDGGEGIRVGKGVFESKGFEGYKGGVLF